MEIGLWYVLADVVVWLVIYVCDGVSMVGGELLLVYLVCVYLLVLFDVVFVEDVVLVVLLMLLLYCEYFIVSMFVEG